MTLKRLANPERYTEDDRPAINEDVIFVLPRRDIRRAFREGFNSDRPYLKNGAMCTVLEHTQNCERVHFHDAPPSMDDLTHPNLLVGIHL